jgi:FMN reductase
MASIQPNLLCLGGSLRPGSYSLATCGSVGEVAENAGFSVEIIDPRELDLPMYVPDFELEHYAPRHEGIHRLIEAYRRADAMVWVSPTYHGTVSGVFKNTIDFAEFLDKDSRPYFSSRAVGLIAINDSTPFAAMRDCARELRAWLAPTQIQLGSSDFDAEMKVASERARGRIARLVEELGTFAQVPFRK